MPTEKQRVASRRNGARSHGPKTPEGKQKSSRNSLKHGLCSDIVVLPGEDPAAYDELVQAYIDRFQPRDHVERSLIEELGACQWRIRRAWATEQSLIIQRIELQEDMVDRNWEDPDDIFRLSLANGYELHQGQAASISRYEARLRNAYQRTMRTLNELRRDRPPKSGGPEQHPIPDEPGKASTPVKSKQKPEAKHRAAAHSAIEMPVEPPAGVLSAGSIYRPAPKTAVESVMSMRN